MTSLLTPPTRVHRAPSALRRAKPTPASANAVGTVEKLVIGLIALAAATTGIRSGLLVPGLRPSQVLIIAAFLISAAAPKGRTKRPVTTQLVDIFAILFVIVRVGTELYDANQLDRHSNLVVAGAPLVYWMAFRSVVRVAGTTDSRRYFCRALAYWSIPVSILGLLQVAKVPGIAKALDVVTASAAVRARVENGDLTRASSVIGHWTSLGGYLVVVICAALTMILSRRRDEPIRLLVVAALLAYLALAATLTYAVLIAGVVVGFVIFRRHRKVGKLVAIMVPIVTIGYLILGSQLSARGNEQFNRQDSTDFAAGPKWLPKSLQFRWDVWLHQMIPAWQQRPITGWGHGNFPNSVVWRFEESSYFGSLVYGGILEVAALFVLMWAMVKVFRARRGSSDPEIVLAASCATISMFLLMTVHPHFTDVGMPVPLWALLGAACAVPPIRATSSRRAGLAHRPAEKAATLAHPVLPGTQSKLLKPLKSERVNKFKSAGASKLVKPVAAVESVAEGATNAVAGARPSLLVPKTKSKTKKRR